MDFARLLEAQTAVENQSGLTLRKKWVEAYLLNNFLCNCPYDLFYVCLNVHFVSLWEECIRYLPMQHLED